MRLAARDRTDAAIAKPEPPFVRVDELGGQFPGMPGAPSHGQNRGLAVGAADQAPRACDSAHGLTEKERAISRLVAPGSRVTSEPDPTTVSRSAPFIRSEPCVCRRVRGWDLEFESGLLRQRVACEPEGIEIAVSIRGIVCGGTKLVGRTPQHKLSTTCEAAHTSSGINRLLLAQVPTAAQDGSAVRLNVGAGACRGSCSTTRL